MFCIPRAHETDGGAADRFREHQHSDKISKIKTGFHIGSHKNFPGGCVFCVWYALQGLYQVADDLRASRGGLRLENLVIDKLGFVRLVRNGADDDKGRVV